jgi:FKBP-type peptidyl-prolyl cis-trans isomerase FklB
MKKAYILILMLIPSIVNAQKSKSPLKNELDTVSYCMGVAIGTSIKMAGLKEFNEKIFMQAIKEILSDKETVFKVEQIDPILRNYFTKMQANKATTNLTEGKKFLEENKKKPGVVTLPSGLQYKITKEGSGASPAVDDKVTVHYHGTLINGKVFDSSKQRGQPVQFAVNGVIKGWTEALQLMKPGSIWTLYIPSDLAYGEQNMGTIEGNSVLIFEVELISVDKEDVSAPAPQKTDPGIEINQPADGKELMERKE